MLSPSTPPLMQGKRVVKRRGGVKNGDSRARWGGPRAGPAKKTQGLESPLCAGVKGIILILNNLTSVA